MIKKIFKVACVQLTSSSSLDENIEQVRNTVKEAANKRADLVCLPECVSTMTDHKKTLVKNFTQNNKNKFNNFIKKLAKNLNVYVLVGSTPFPKNDGKFLNRSLIIDKKGLVVSYYDKINLFDVILSKNEKYLESKTYSAGKYIKVHTLPWGKIGMSICYDIRFPLIYRKLAKKKVDFVTIPAAFTYTTGKAHWEILIRARAIENGFFIFAPAQCGKHDNGRETFGNSMIVDPWGKILSRAKKKPTIIYAQIDTSEVTNARKKIPAMTDFTF